jgi:hypothetical protein
MSNTDLTPEESIRKYFRGNVDLYVQAAKKVGLPVDEENLQSIMDNAEIILEEDESTTGTFAVSREKIIVNMNNFKKNGSSRNTFLLLHEIAHLDSAVLAELDTDPHGVFQRLKDIEQMTPGDGVSGLNAYFGIIAIDEVLAQWTCDELHAAIHNKERSVHEYSEGPLGSRVKFRSDFTKDDIYSPLEEVVEKLLQSSGFKDLREFACKALASDMSVVDMIQGDNFRALCQIGIICCAIYNENGFYDAKNVSREEVEHAFENLHRFSDYGENGGQHEIE